MSPSPMSSSRAAEWMGTTETEPGELKSVTTLLEVSQALLSRLELRESLERALAVLTHRLLGVRRVLVRLHDEIEDVELDLASGAADPPPGATPMSSPIVLAGVTIGLLRADVTLPPGRDHERLAMMFNTVATMIAEAVRGHRVIQSEQRRLSEENANLRQALRDSDLAQGGSGGASFRASMDAFEKDALIAALKRARGNRARAARLLSTTERIFNYRVRKHGIDWRKYKV